jgi:TRAP-type C4-dicarboxylate transport system substrate-binding protein
MAKKRRRPEMRRFLAAFALAALALWPGPSSAREFKISHQWPAGADARDRAVKIFVQEMQSRSPHLSFRVYPALSLNIKAADQIDALQSGSLEMSVYPLSYAVKKSPEFSLTGLPALFPSLDAVRSLKGSRVLEYLQEVAHANGVHILAWWWVPGAFATTGAEIAGPETVKGLKLRSGNRLFNLMLKEAGAETVDIPSNELYEGLRSGKLDGVLTSYETFLSMRLYEHAKFVTAGSPGIWMFVTTLLISKSVWDSLSDEEQAAFEAAAAISEDYFAATQRDAEKRFIEVFTKAGAKYRKFTLEDYLGWLRLAQETAWAEYLAISPATKEMLFDTITTIVENGQSAWAN